MASSASRVRFRFWAKVGAAAALVVLGDRLFYVGGGLGSAIGMFAMAWAVATLLLQPAMRRDRRAIAAFVLAAGYAAVLYDDPSLLAWSLFWVALAIATLLPRTGAFDNAWRWADRLLVHGATGLFGPLLDIRRLARLRPQSGRPGLRSSFPVLALPLIGSAVFIALFAVANPLIGDALAAIKLPSLDQISIIRTGLWLILLLLVWSSFRPRKIRVFFPAVDEESDYSLPGVSISSVTLSLILFNSLFALQNGLDLAFLWSDAGLPEGVTLADYAHRGAYPLIATALLAGLFVLVTLRPGSETAAVPLIRRLVVIWVGQNIFLVASSILRTIDYVEAYSLTRLRIAALAWMLLVAIGLFLICWRMLRARSAGWLINANTFAAGLLLSIASIVDLGAVTAAWNVRNAREVAGSGAGLDLCYLDGLGAAALVSLVELEQRPLTPGFRDRVTYVRQKILNRTKADQASGWWTWRNDRRLHRTSRMMAGKPWPKPMIRKGWRRGCDGQLIAPPPPLPAPPPSAATATELPTSQAQPLTTGRQR
jgi:hypothetical protein